MARHTNTLSTNRPFRVNALSAICCVRTRLIEALFRALAVASIEEVIEPAELALPLRFALHACLELKLP